MVMNPEEQERQEKLHVALQELVTENEGDGMLTGWIVVWEMVRPDDVPVAGHLYGPAGMTTWRALGLTEWARQHTLAPDGDDE